MTTSFSQILEHPKYDEIMEKILKGVSIPEIAQWLRLEYTDKDQNHLRISEKILKDFSKSSYMDYASQVKKDLIKVERGEAIDKKISKSILNNKTYQERLNEYTDEVIDIKKNLIEFDRVMRDRMEQIFDKIQEDPGDLGNKGDYKFLKYFEQYLKLIETYDKSINNRPDQVIQHNYTLEYIDKRTAVIQDAIRATLEKLGPEATSIFMDEMNIRLQNLEYQEDNKLPKLDPKILME